MSTRWGAGDFDILAATLMKPRPLLRTFVPLEPGLSVLYGRNGAGKTRLLEGLEASLAGSQGRAWAWLHIRIRDRVTLPDRGLTSHLIKMIGGPRSPHAEGTTEHEIWVSNLAQQLISYWEMFIDDPEALANEVARNGVLSLIPVGTEDRPRWRVYASALPDDETPLLSARASRYREEWLAALQIDDATNRDEQLWSAGERFGLEAEAELDVDNAVPFSEPGQPMLLVELGTLSLDRPLCDIYGRPRQDINGLTLDRLLYRDGPRRQILATGTDQLRQPIVEDLEHLSSRATEIYELVLERAPRLRCELAPVELWLTEPALRWVADDIDGPSDLEISELSRAQRRWAEIAIGVTLKEFTASGEGAVMLLDEPELALHSLAVRTMSRGLERLAQTIGVDIIAATHAAGLLDAASGNLWHVSRDGGGSTVVHTVSGFDEEQLGALGLTKAELLQLTHLFVVVEGLHDQIVVEETCGLELNTARARIIPLRGASNAASLIDANFLLRFTDANFLVVLDAIPPQTVDDAWTEARQAWLTNCDARATDQALRISLPSAAGAEFKFLRELMISCLVNAQAHRLRFRTLSQPDVVYYLPLEAFTSRPGTWQSLAVEHAAASTKLNFKDWLEKQKNLSFTEAAVRGAAQRLDRLDPDLIALGRAILDDDPDTANS